MAHEDDLLIEVLERISVRLFRIERRVGEIMIDQETFDTDLAALVTAIAALVAAVDALIASKATADLTAEDTSVQAAAASVADELGKLTPPAA
jgi:hypothetical protein